MRLSVVPKTVFILFVELQTKYADTFMIVLPVVVMAL